MGNHVSSKTVSPACDTPELSGKRPGLLRLLGLFAVVLLIGNLLSKLGWLKPNVTFGSAMSVGAIFVVGLVAASSSCIALAGGLLLSVAAKFNEKFNHTSRVARMRPVVLFVVGRVIGYGVLGGLLGVIGSVLAPSSAVTGVITIIAALYMLVMGLDMLGYAPAFLKRLVPRMPKIIAHRIMDKEDKTSMIAPFLFGAATFFLPCGFTQALQLYALSTGSFWAGAVALTAFALGTAPALLGLGFASSALHGRAGKWFYQFSGALVIMLGLWNVQNGFTVAGFPLSLPTFAWASQSDAAGLAASSNPNIVWDGDTQIAQMTVGDQGYLPNHFTVVAGKPVRWEVDGTHAGGCLNVLVSRGLGVQHLLTSGINVIEFVPRETGEVAFSCSMGMYRGSFTVIQ